MEKIVAIDASEISPIMKNLGLEGLIATAKRGDHFFYSNDFELELKRSGFFETRNGELFEDWIDKQRNPPPGYTPDVSIVEIDDVLDREMDTYDPNQKRFTEKGGYETWDMSIRKRMVKHPDFDYEVICREKDFFENKNRDKKKYDPVTRRHAKIVDVPFRYTTVKKLMAEMVVNPDLNLSKEQFMNIQSGWNTRFGEVKGLHQGALSFPETYEEALRQQAFRSKPRGAISGFGGRIDGRLGGLPFEPGRPVSALPAGAPADGLPGRELDLNASISGRVKGALQDGPSIGKRFMKLAKKGAPVAVLGLAAVPVIGIVKARADERNISFAQAAREVGLDFTEDDLKALAADFAVDLGVSLTPVGALKKAWDVAGNFDDIVALAQLYGEAYPDNAVIQEMAAIAKTVEDSAAFSAYVNGRDALVGAVGGAIDWVFSSSEDEEELARNLGALRASAATPGGAVDQALRAGASRQELTETFKASLQESLSGEAVSLSGWQNIPGAAPAREPFSSPFPRETQPGAAPDGVPELAAMAGSEGWESPGPGLQSGLNGAGMAPAADGLDVASMNAGMASPQRKTSYDTYRRIGTSPEEEAEALEDFRALSKESFVEMGGHREAAEDLALWKFKRKWNLSAFSPEAEGTVVKHPVETVYPDVDGSGHGYVRQDAEAYLKEQGIKAAKWYLSANEKTGRDRQQGQTDDQGFGPRMTLYYDDETGARHEATDSFQADVRGASRRRTQATNRKRREELAQYDRSQARPAAAPKPAAPKPAAPKLAGQAVPGPFL